jgi:hypothetical protein
MAVLPYHIQFLGGVVAAHQSVVRATSVNSVFPW